MDSRSSDAIASLRDVETVMKTSKTRHLLVPKTQLLNRVLAGALMVLLTICSSATQAQAEDLLKPDVPKLDSTVPKSSTMLKGGVQRLENNKPSPKPLSGNANTASAGASKFKLFSGHAKADKHKTMRAQAQNNSPLNANVQSGIGIIGVKFVLSFGRPPVINRVFPGTPAFTEGLRDKDVIVAVDGVPTFGLSKEEVYGMIVGAPGTPVTVSVSRNGDFVAKTMTRMDFNDITDPLVRHDYLLNM
jgi:C-terminal processing protease CtpA/Prc